VTEDETHLHEGFVKERQWRLKVTNALKNMDAAIALSTSHVDALSVVSQDIQSILLDKWDDMKCHGAAEEMDFQSGASRVSGEWIGDGWWNT
tara:strand:+ start:1514 stop:1789 length:276 start_codon:yes stop_codon:yes gene_type:complete